MLSTLKMSVDPSPILNQCNCCTRLRLFDSLQSPWLISAEYRILWTLKSDLSSSSYALTKQKLQLELQGWTNLYLFFLREGFKKMKKSNLDYLKCQPFCVKCWLHRMKCWPQHMKYWPPACNVCCNTLNVCQGPKGGLDVPPRAKGAPLLLYMKKL